MLSSQKMMSAPSGGANYIDDVFSTYLYTGDGTSSRTITNGIDLSTKGGLVWDKYRGNGWHHLVDTARGAPYSISSNSTGAQGSPACTTGFTTSGYTVGADSNNTGDNYVSWTFRKQAKFFDIVTFTQTSGTGYITVNHNLGSAPGCIMVKRTDAAGDWYVYHRSLGTSQVIFLNYTDAAQAGSDFQSVTSTSFQFTNFDVGATYVAYLFAHDAGGFGAAGTDNVISCGSFTTGSSTTTINLGFEPQWILMKEASVSGSWWILDTMRGLVSGGNDAYLSANGSGSEGQYPFAEPTATGFISNDSDWTSSGRSVIYIAIRRPMKPPTTGTEVFSPVLRAGTGSAATVTSGFVTDLHMARSTSGTATGFRDRLRGANQYMRCPRTDAEATGSGTSLDLNTGIKLTTEVNGSGENWINYQFRRAPGFFDQVCYSGNQTSGRTVTHNLGVAPEFMIVKVRNSDDNWTVYHSGIGPTKFLWLNTADASYTYTNRWNDTAPTSSVFTLGNEISVNGNGYNYVAYLFATLEGVSKVGSYTGTGSSIDIDCGFSGGARFILLKRTTSSGQHWYMWDTVRGIVSGNDPFVLLSNELAEYTSYDYIDPYAAGFTVNSGISVAGENYVYLAIA